MHLEQLIAANQHTLTDVAQILRDISDEAYTDLTAPFSASIGKHMRHIADHYNQFIDGCANQRVNYDARVRDERVENSRANMIDLITTINHQLSSFSSKSDKTLSVVLSVDENTSAPAVNSTFARELVFLQSHTTHHCAIISAILKLQGIIVPENFGIAASTIRFDQQRCAH